MNLTEAINLAKQGRSVGWGTIISATYNEKKFITSKYLNVNLNPVLHDSYVKALTNIRFLNNPNVFSSWLGIIIASITAERLTKKKLVDFSKVGYYTDETWYSDVLKDDTNNISENIGLSNKEIKDSARKLLKSLSREQKLCIIYHYYEGFTVKETSRALKTSEEAIISFLNSGIKSLEAVMDELKKSYTQFSEFSDPIHILIFLMKSEYNNHPKESVPDELFNSIIEDTAAIIAESFVAEENEIAEKEEVTEENEDNENDETDEENENKAGGLSGNKKIIIIAAVIIAMVAGVIIHFVNKNDKPAEPANKPSESDTVSDTEPTIDITEEDSTEDSSEDTSEEEPTDNEPISNQTPTASSNNSSSNNNNNSNYTVNNSNNIINNNNSNSTNNNNNNSSSNNTNSATTAAKPTAPTTQPTTSAPKPTQPVTEAPKPTQPATEAPTQPSVTEPDFEIPDIG